MGRKRKLLRQKQEEQTRQLADTRKELARQRESLEALAEKLQKQSKREERLAESALAAQILALIAEILIGLDS